MQHKNSVVRRSHTRIAAALYLAVFLVIAAVFIRHSAPIDSSLEIAGNNADSAKYFKNLAIEARAVYIYDTVSEKVIWQKNSELPLPLASVTKVMTALCALDNLDENGYITIPVSQLEEDGDIDLVPGERIRVSDLVAYTLVKSSNDGAVALSGALGGSRSMVSCMNAKAEDHELFDTHFDNETGLDIGSLPGAYGSAEDAAKLLLSAYRKYPDIFGATRYESYNVPEGTKALEAINTNKAQSMITGMQSSKTGLTDTAGGNLVFIMNAGLGHNVAVSILGSSEQGRFTDALTISKAVIDYLGETR